MSMELKVKRYLYEILDAEVIFDLCKKDINELFETTIQIIKDIK